MLLCLLVQRQGPVGGNLVQTEAAVQVREQVPASGWFKLQILTQILLVNFQQHQIVFAGKVFGRRLHNL